MTDNYPAQPPEYNNARDGATSPLLQQVPEEAAPNYVRPGDSTSIPANGGGNEANIPDDFKYGTSVADCVLGIRNAFIRKVYTILTAQVLLTVAVSATIILNQGIKQWALTHIWTIYLSLFGSIAFMIGAFVTQRSYPKNLIFLGGFTLFESYAIGTISSLYDTNVVLLALLITTVVFVGLTLFAFQTRYDLTGWQGFLGMILWGMIGFGFVAIFFPYSSKVELIYSIIGAIVFSGYILVDTQLILRRFHPEDEIAASISLYLDIINLFLNILRILNEVYDSDN